MHGIIPPQELHAEFHEVDFDPTDTFLEVSFKWRSTFWLGINSSFPLIYPWTHICWRLLCCTIQTVNADVEYLPQYQHPPNSAFHWHQLNIKAVNYLSSSPTVLPTFNPSNHPCVQPIRPQLPNDNAAANGVKSLSKPQTNDIRCSALILVVISTRKKSITEKAEISFIISEVFHQQIIQP